MREERYLDFRFINIPEIIKAEAHNNNEIACIPTNVGGMSRFLILMTLSVHRLAPEFNFFSDEAPFSKFCTDVTAGDSSDFILNAFNGF